MTGTTQRGASVRIANVRVTYRDAERPAVDDVSLDIEAGELVVLLGPSGCGKSTLLRTINRLIVPDSGSIEIDGVDTATVSPETLRRGIGYAIQAVGLFPHLSVARNVAVVPELLGWAADRVTKRVDELLALVNLAPERYRDRLPRELSGGEQQRVGVARALAASPPLLLMDEPFGAVDAIVRGSLQDEVARIHAALGTTIVFVTHDVDEGIRLADRLVVMEAGRIVQADTPLRVLARPATPFVERLLDAHDVVRRLQLVRAGEAAVPASATPPDARIDAGATLRDALNRFLEGDARLTVVANGAPAGELDFAALRAALARAEA